MKDAKVQKLWESYFASKESGSPNKAIESKLVEYYYPLVKRIANKVHQKITDVEPDELASYGVDGLYDVIQNYDRSHNTKFETYATPRIRGSMLDEIRKLDWVPRLVRSKAARLDSQKQKYENRAGHKLTDQDMATRLGMSLEEYDDYVRGATTPAVHSVNELMNNDNENEKQLSIEHLEDHGTCQPIDDMLRRELFSKLMGNNFTPQERSIIRLYYYEDLSMKEISEKVNLSESRVSQMHSIILRRLLKKADRNPNYFSDIFAITDKFKEPAEVC